MSTALRRRIASFALPLVAVVGTISVLLTTVNGRGNALDLPMSAKPDSARTITFESRNADRRALFEAERPASPVTVTATFVPPRGTSGPAPAAVLLHGSDGVSRLQFRYAEWLADQGIGALVIDSFGARGVADTIGKQTLVNGYSMLSDAYAALAALQEVPEVDGRKVIVIGWSKGGLAADWAARERYRRAMGSSHLRFAGHVMFYPWCGEQEAEPSLTGAPLLYLLAGRDDWSGSRACLDYVARLEDAGYPAEAQMYANAHHGFDYPGVFKRYIKNAKSWRECAYFLRDDGFIVASTGRYEDWSALSEYLARCSRNGAHVASSPGARSTSRDALKRFMESVLNSAAAGAPPNGHLPG